MKKNVFSRTIAVLASTAVLGAASMMSASAAGESVSISSETAKAGETVTLTVSVGANDLFESFDCVVSYDTALTASAAKGAGDCSVQSAVNADNVTVVGFGSGPIKDGAVATIDFTIPADATPGTTYNVDFAAMNNFGTYEADGETAGADVAETVAKSGGVITVAEEPTEAPETTAAAEETTAAPTTAAPTKGAPKTGTAGVAVAVAGLVTAGAAAVVLKKRH